MTQYVELSTDGTAVTTLYAGPQQTDNKPTYAELADGDARVTAYRNKTAGALAYAAALGAGCPISSTGTPALDGTYAIDQAIQGAITSEHVYIATTGKFTNGQDTLLAR